MLLAYSLSGKKLSIGKHALLNLGNAELAEIILSDPQGANVMAVSQSPTDMPFIEVVNHELKIFPNPFKSELKIRLVSGYNNAKVDIVFTDILGRVIHKISIKQPNGVREYSWNPATLGSGVYFCTLLIDSKQVETKKVIYVK
jgi:hypothetical protein